MRYLLIIVFISIGFSMHSQHHLIPIPASYTSNGQSYALEKGLDITLGANDELSRNTANRLIVHFKEIGYDVNINVSRSGQSANGIVVNFSRSIQSQVGEHGYILEVSSEKITLEAMTPSGIHNGLMTIRQMIPAHQKGTQQSIDGCKIVDYPRFGWRGLMFDVSRHFFTVEEVKSYLDVMEQYKMNTFHWHLTDDNGWRIEIKSFPKLTEVGAWRAERKDKYGNRKSVDPIEPKTYGGFYTQEQIKEVVAYADERNITIVPEIDVPGHSMALLAAYPEYSTLKEKKYVDPGTAFSEWFADGSFKMLTENTLNPADEKVYDMLDKIFGEVAKLFPNKYIHVGGDECDHRFWMADEGCQALMKKEGLHDGEELQGYFMKRLEKIISSHGKIMMGWDEILLGGLADGAAVMSWQGIAGGIEAAKQGHDVVMSPTTHVYLDYTQGDHSLENKIYADLSLGKTYSFDPVPEGVDAKYILGVQGNVWTEQIPTLDHAFYMTYPRGLAIAEIGWSPLDKKNWNDFTDRLETHFDIFERDNLSISKAVYDPILKVTKKDGKTMVDVSCELDNVDFYYTLDFTFPNHRTHKYTGPIEIPKGNVLFKIVSYRNGKQIGRMISLAGDELRKRVR